MLAAQVHTLPHSQCHLDLGIYVSLYFNIKTRGPSLSPPSHSELNLAEDPGSLGSEVTLEIRSAWEERPSQRTRLPPSSPLWCCFPSPHAWGRLTLRDEGWRRGAGRQGWGVGGMREGNAACQRTGGWSEARAVSKEDKTVSTRLPAGQAFCRACELHGWPPVSVAEEWAAVRRSLRQMPGPALTQKSREIPQARPHR